MITIVLWYVLKVYLILSYLLMGYLLFKEHQEHEYEGTPFEVYGAVVVLFVMAPLVMLYILLQKLRGTKQPGVM